MTFMGQMSIIAQSEAQEPAYRGFCELDSDHDVSSNRVLRLIYLAHQLHQPHIHKNSSKKPRYACTLYIPWELINNVKSKVPHIFQVEWSLLVVGYHLYHRFLTERH